MTRTIKFLALTTALLAAQPSLAQETRARLGHVFATGSSQDEGANQFAACVGERTGGAISVTVFPDGQLGGDEAMGRDMSRGGQELAFINPGSLTGLDPLLDFHYLPYIVSNNDEADAVFYNPDGIIQKTLRETMAEHGMHVLGFYEVEFRAVTNSSKPVQGVEDLKGLKIRVPGSIAIRSFFDTAGSQSVTIPYPELFVALQQGTVDGQDNGASLTFKSRLFEAQDYMTLTNHVYAMSTIAASEWFWDSLTGEQQAALEACADEVGKAQVAANRAAQTEYIAEIREGGVQVYEPTAEEMDGFVALGRSLWPELGETYGAERVEALRAEVTADGN